MDKFDKYLPVIKKQYPDYRFSWQISTEIILDQLRKNPYWLDIGARNNERLKIHPEAVFGVGLDLEAEDRVYTDANNCFCIGSVYNIPMKNDSYDFISSRFVFEHLEKPADALKEIAGALKPGGIFLLETTNKWNPLLVMARVIPFFIKKIIIKKLFKDNPSGTYKTSYKLNTPSAYKKLDLSSIHLKLEQLYIVNDVICESKLLFTISFGLFKLIKLFGLNDLYGNIVVVFRKV